MSTAAVVLLLVAACDGAEDREAAFMERGLSLLESGELTGAAREFRNALRIDPANSDARFYIGLIKERRGEWREAYAAFKAVVSRDIGHAGANNHLARFHMLAGDTDEARNRLDRVLERDPANSDARALLAALYLRQERIDEAIELASAVLAGQPRHLQALSVLVSAYRRQNEPDRALQLLNDAISSSDPSAVESLKSLLLMRIGVYLSRNERDTLRADFRRLIALAPNDPALHVAHARAHLLLGQVDEAEDALREAVRVAPNRTEYEELLSTFVRQKRNFETAESSLRDLVARHPASRAFRFGLAALYTDHERADSARSLYSEIISARRSPEEVAQARLALARLYLARNDSARALQLVERVLADDPGNMDAIYAAARIDFTLGSLEPAIDKLRRYLQRDPESRRALRLLSAAYLHSNRLPEAAETMESLVRVEHDNVDVRIRLARVYALQRRHDAALALVDEVLADAPQSREGFAAKVEILSSSGRFEEAAQTLSGLLDDAEDKPAIYQQMGQMYLRAGNYAAAIAAFERAARPGSAEPRIVTGLVTALIGLGNYERARQLLEEQIRQRPDEAYLHNLRGEVFGREQALEQAHEAFDRAIALRPDWPVPYLNKSGLLSGRGNFSGAVDVIRRGLAASPHDVPLRFALALNYQELGRIGPAIEAYEDVLEREPQIDAAANNLAALIADHQYEDAARLRRALSLSRRFRNSQNPDYLDTHGWVHFRLGNYREAIRYLESAVALASDRPDFRYHLGMAYFRADDMNSAHDHLLRAISTEDDHPWSNDARAAMNRVVLQIESQ